MSSSQPEIYIGLMSGTSMDGIDAALVDFSGSQPKLINTHSHPWPKSVQQALIKARDIADEKLDSLSSLDCQTAEIFAKACFKLLQNTAYQAPDIIAIGNHGQTIRHRPDIENPFSLQIGNAKKLAELTDIDVISDFRTADIEAGGQGAPLAPAFHQAMFQHDKINRVIVNIGGIANITVLPKNGNQSATNQSVTGFDCGPGNTLMDAWIWQQQQQSYDANGSLAASGKTNATLLAKLLLDEYFQLAPPKSTGFEYFKLEWLDKYIDNELASEMNSADVQSTLCDLTATSIIQAINQYAQNTNEIYICGGGVHNKELMRRLQALTKCSVMTTEALGVHPDWVEAMAFAWLAYQNIHQQTGNLPSVTGAGKAVVLGGLTRHL
jgi:anhydro-N-acetylmuramic acid kinase